MKDYCTLSPDFINGKYIGNICRQHDCDYFHQHITRIQADHLFWARLEDVVGDKWAKVYYTFVRLFGWIPWYYQKLKKLIK